MRFFITKNQWIIYIIFHLKDFQGIFLGGGDSLNHPPRNLIIPSGFVDHHFPPKKKRHLCHHLCHQDTNWIPLVGQGGSSKFKPRWFCDSFLYSKNPYSRPKLGPSNTNHGQFEFFGLLMSVFVWKQKKSTTGNFSTSPFPKGEATKSHHHQPWTLFAATVAGQDKANAGHHLDITPPPPPRRMLAHHHQDYITTFLGDRESPYKPLCATLTGRGVDPIYFSTNFIHPR